MRSQNSNVSWLPRMRLALCVSKPLFKLRRTAPEGKLFAIVLDNNDPGKHRGAFLECKGCRM